jgi:hypothetical protein
MSHSQHLSLSGLPIPSVSEVPGIFAVDIRGFEDWLCKQNHGPEDRCCVAARRRFYQESADLGNDIHELMAAFLKGESFEEGVPEYQAAVFDPVAKFLKDTDYKPLYIEQKMTGIQIGGTLDTAGTFSVPFWEEQRKTFWADDGPEVQYRPETKDVWIVDLKIKSKLDKLHPLQLYGYSLLLKECYNVEAKWGLIIRREKKLDKTPEIQLKGYYLPAYKPQWDAAMLMWHFLND